MTSSGVRLVESIDRASGAGRSGATGRLASRASRCAMSQERSAQANINPLFFQLLMAPHRALVGARRQEHLEAARRGKPRCPCPGRRRPGPGGRAKSRCRCSSASRTAGTAATREAASPGAFGPEGRGDVLAVEQDLLAAAEPRRSCTSIERAMSRVALRGSSGVAAAAPPRAPRAGRARRCRAGASRSRPASPRLIVPLPEPLGPSIVTIGTAGAITAAHGARSDSQADVGRDARGSPERTSPRSAMFEMSIGARASRLAIANDIAIR